MKTFFSTTDQNSIIRVCFSLQILDMVCTSKFDSYNPIDVSYSTNIVAESRIFKRELACKTSILG